MGYWEYVSTKSCCVRDWRALQDRWWFLELPCLQKHDMRLDTNFASLSSHVAYITSSHPCLVSRTSNTIASDGLSANSGLKGMILTHLRCHARLTHLSSHDFSIPAKCWAPTPVRPSQENPPQNTSLPTIQIQHSYSMLYSALRPLPPGAWRNSPSCVSFQLSSYHEINPALLHKRARYEEPRLLA